MLLYSLSFRHSFLLTRACSNGRVLSTLPSSTSLGYLPTTHSPVIPKLAFFNSVTGDGSKIPNYRVLDELGVPVEGAEVPQVRVVPFHLQTNSPTLRSIQLSKQFAWRLWVVFSVTRDCILRSLEDMKICSCFPRWMIYFAAANAKVEYLSMYVYKYTHRYLLT
jgi:hypothetical protein